MKSESVFLVSSGFLKANAFLTPTSQKMLVVLPAVVLFLLSETDPRFHENGRLISLCLKCQALLDISFVIRQLHKHIRTTTKILFDNKLTLLLGKRTRSPSSSRKAQLEAVVSSSIHITKMHTCRFIFGNTCVCYSVVADKNNTTTYVQTHLFWCARHSSITLYIYIDFFFFILISLYESRTKPFIAYCLQIFSNVCRLVKFLRYSKML